MNIIKQIFRGNDVILVVDSEYADEVIRTFGTKEDMYGMFLCEENGMWVAIDNTTKDAWTEEFHTMEWAIKWLTNCVNTDRAHEMDERLHEKRQRGE